MENPEGLQIGELKALSRNRLTHQKQNVSIWKYAHSSSFSDLTTKVFGRKMEMWLKERVVWMRKLWAFHLKPWNFVEQVTSFYLHQNAARSYHTCDITLRSHMDSGFKLMWCHLHSKARKWNILKMNVESKLNIDKKCWVWIHTTLDGTQLMRANLLDECNVICHQLEQVHR